MADEYPHPEREPRRDPAAPEPVHSPEPPAGEDASAQALSEALRSSFTLVKFLVAALVLAFFVSGVFTVEPNQVAIKLRFGKPVGIGADQLLQPGLHWKWPFPIEDFVRIPVGESHVITSTAGWYHQTPDQLAAGMKPAARGFLQAGVDGYTLTGDGNIIHARMTLSYRIVDPLNYVFGFENVTNLLQHVLDNALIYASARIAADDALYLNPAAFRETVLERVNETLEKLNLGVTIESREIRAEPPVDVATAFDDVSQAQQRSDQNIVEAGSYARTVTNNAAGEAILTMRGALTSSNELVTTLAQRADEFNKLLPHYQREPELFKQRLLAETVERVLTNSQYKLYLPESADGQPVEVRLQLGKPPEPRQRRPAAAP